MKYTTLLLDMDGTIIHSIPVWLDAFSHAHKQFEHEIPYERIVEEFVSTQQMSVPTGITNDAFFESVYAYVEQHIDEIRLHNSVEDFLQRIQKQGIHCAVVTSSYRRFADRVLGHLEVTSYFDTILTREDVTYSKPHPEMLIKAMDLCNGSPDKTLMVGDSLADIEAAKRAHLRTVAWFYPPEHHTIYTADMFHVRSPDYTIGHFHDLLPILT